MKSTFRLEEDLLRALQRSLPREIVSRGSTRIDSYAKIAVGMTIPDLVATTSGGRRETLRTISFFECAVVSQLLRRGTLQIGQIQRALFARPVSVHRAIANLESYGLIRVRAAECWLRAGVLAGVMNIVSIEAKLDRWKEALCQAQDYRRFSNSAYVALPEEKIRKAPAIAMECAVHGIGLLAVATNRCSVIVRAPVSNPRTPEWVWLVSRTVGFRAQLSSKLPQRLESVRKLSAKRIDAGFRFSDADSPSGSS